jgi:hypothetical protein
VKNINRIASIFALMALVAFGVAAASDNGPHTSSMFQGPKANTGTVSHFYENGKSILRVSDDFKVPDTPAPTWRVVDSKATLHARSLQNQERRKAAGDGALVRTEYRQGSGALRVRGGPPGRSELSSPVK